MRVIKTFDGGVNVDKLLEKESSVTDLPPLPTYIIETGMNSLSRQHACADYVKYKIIPNGKFDKALQVLDNGRGMNYEIFKEYHKCYSKTSFPRIHDINFRGMGDKGMLLRVRNIFTETKQMGKHYASRWSFNPDTQNTKVEIIDTVGIKSEILNTGTCITANLKELLDIEILNEQYLTSLIQHHFVGVLLGEYGDLKILFEDETGTVKQITGKYPHPKEYKKHYIRTLDKIGDWVDEKHPEDNGHYPPKCMFFYSDEPLPDEDCGIWIIVGKKTICRMENWFGLFPKEQQNHIRGYIIADYLVDTTVNAGKDGLKSNSKKYKEFYQEAGKEWGKFLNTIEVPVEKPIVEEDTLKVVDKVAEEMSALIKNKWDKINLLTKKKKTVVTTDGTIVEPIPPKECPECHSIKQIALRSMVEDTVEDEINGVKTDKQAIFYEYFGDFK